VLDSDGLIRVDVAAQRPIEALSIAPQLASSLDAATGVLSRYAAEFEVGPPLYCRCAMLVLKIGLCFCVGT
jgi:hypothetical protein